jgi:hypothetical protein
LPVSPIVVVTVVALALFILLSVGIGLLIMAPFAILLEGPAILTRVRHGERR